ncbi:MAG: ribosomal protein S18-alanine N-acetyltransferase, partial [Armatimonadota bacterium]
MTADGQALTVDMVADGSSSLAIALQNGSSLTGSIDAARISGTSIANTLGNGHTVTGLKEIASYIRQLFLRDRFSGSAGQGIEYLAGMAGIWMMVDEAHIVTIAVRNNRKNLGLGEWLLINIIELAVQLRAKYVTLEVRVSNKTAQALYEKYGFTRAGTRKKYYSDNGEDALIMTTFELNSPAYRATLQNL